jgi:hypothetical protein
MKRALRCDAQRLELEADIWSVSRAEIRCGLRRVQATASAHSGCSVLVNGADEARDWPQPRDESGAPRAALILNYLTIEKRVIRIFNELK